MAATQLNGNRGEAVVHVRFAGRSFDIPLASLDLGAMSADGHVKRALARHLNVPEFKLDAYVVDRHANGNLTLRPEAVFGDAERWHSCPAISRTAARGSAIR